MRRSAVLAALTAAALLAGCGRGAGAGSEGRLTAHGDVSVVRAGGLTQTVHGRTALHRGDQVDVGGEATADVALPGGATLELRDGSRVRFDGGPALVAGDLLVAAHRAPVHVAADTGSVSVRGVSRLRRDLTLTAATYQGHATLATAGRTLTVPAYRQAAVVAQGLLPDHAGPLVLNDADPWDRRYLGRAIDLTAQLDEASHGFTAVAGPGNATDAAFFRSALQPLAAEATFSDGLIAATRTPLQADRPAGEVLVGSAIALAGQGGTFDTRWQAVFAFRDEGAAWGLVALDQRADGAGLIGLINDAINRSPLQYAAPALGQPTPDRGQALGGGPPASPPATAAPRTSPPAGPTTPRTAPPPVTVPSTPVTVPPPSAPSPLSPVVDPVNQLVNGLAGGSLLGG